MNRLGLYEKELFNKKESGVAYKSNFKMGSKIRDIKKLNIGDYVVHVVHGIGIYRGIKTLTKNGLKKDYLTIEYKGELYNSVRALCSEFDINPQTYYYYIGKGMSVEETIEQCLQNKDNSR